MSFFSQLFFSACVSAPVHVCVYVCEQDIRSKGDYSESHILWSIKGCRVPTEFPSPAYFFVVVFNARHFVYLLFHPFYFYCIRLFALFFYTHANTKRTMSKHNERYRRERGRPRYPAGLTGCLKCRMDSHGLMQHPNPRAIKSLTRMVWSYGYLEIWDFL